MDTTPVRSAQRVVEALDLAGVRYVFGIPGAKIDAVFDALLDGSAELVVCRHEQNAAFMAAAIGRLTGTPGVVLVTSGPGTSNLATGLVTATTEQDPVVAICGAVPRDQRLKHTHQSMDAAGLLGTVTKFVGEVDAPDDVAETVANAFRLAATHPRGATAVVLPADVAAAVTAAALTTMPTVPRMGPAPTADITRAAEAVRAARSPVLLVGDRGSDPEVTAALHRLMPTLTCRSSRPSRVPGCCPANSRRTTWAGSAFSGTNPVMSCSPAPTSSSPWVMTRSNTTLRYGTPTRPGRSFTSTPHPPE